MTPAQLSRLLEIQNRLVDVALNDADPENWTASDMYLKDMTSEQRGDAAWCRKTAVQTVALLIRVQQLTQVQAPEDDKQPDPEQDIKRYEKAAREMIERVGAQGRNAH